MGEITKKIKIDIGEFSTEHPVYVVYDAHKFVLTDEDRDHYDIKKFKPEDLGYYITSGYYFQPYVELENEYIDELSTEYINIYGEDTEYPIFQTYEEAEAYRSKMQSEADKENADNRYKIAKDNLTKAIKSYYDTIGQNWHRIDLDQVRSDIVYRLKQDCVN